MLSFKENFLAINASNVMCRNLVSADWQGYLYDCDFNQPELLGAVRPHPHGLLQADLQSNIVRVADHCHGYTA